MSDRQAELAALRVAARAYVEWEAEVSGQGIPVRTEVRARPEASPSAAPARPDASPVLSPSGGETGALGARERAQSRHALANGQDSALSLAPRAPVPPPEGEETVATSHGGSAAETAERGVAHEVPAAAGDKRARLALLEQEARDCSRCGLAQGRTQAVFSRGDPDARLMFVGEGPGFEEDRSGLPFVGPAGKLLDRMVAAMGFAREAVYICNVVKCRPPGNRTPLPEEGRACSSFLHGQLDAVQPAVIVALGRCATENLGLVGAGGGWRGRWGRFRGFDVMPTYHPAFLLRSPEFKRPVWEDLQKVMGRLKDPR